MSLFETRKETQLNDEFEEYVIKRCEKALLECKEYIEKENNGDVTPDELQAMAEELCYKKGFADALNITKNIWETSLNFDLYFIVVTVKFHKITTWERERCIA